MRRRVGFWTLILPPVVELESSSSLLLLLRGAPDDIWSRTYYTREMSQNGKFSFLSNFIFPESGGERNKKNERERERERAKPSVVLSCVETRNAPKLKLQRNECNCVYMICDMCLRSAFGVGVGVWVGSFFFSIYSVPQSPPLTNVGTLLGYFFLLTVLLNPIFFFKKKTFG